MKIHFWCTCRTLFYLKLQKSNFIFATFMLATEKFDLNSFQKFAPVHTRRFDLNSFKSVKIYTLFLLPFLLAHWCMKCENCWIFCDSSVKILILILSNFTCHNRNHPSVYIFRSSQLFWTDRHYPRIESSNLDGSGRRIFVDNFIGKPNALAIDFENRQLCWTDAGLELGYLTVNPKIGKVHFIQ